MACRTAGSYFLAVFAAALILAGCAPNQQSRFQAAFLPAMPPATAARIPEPPALEPTLYVKDAPPVIRMDVPVPVFSARSDALIARAQQRYERARKLYHANDLERARQEFDAAVDLMLSASEHPLADRQSCERKLEQMVDAIHRYDLVGLGAGAVMESASFEKAPLEDILEMTFPVDPKLKLKAKEQLHATLSQLPLTVTDAVLGYIHYFNGRGRRTMIAGLERAGRYRPMIQRILAEEGVPQELIYLAQAESGFQARARSRKAATGMWQFMQWRGKEYGLTQTSYTDDRLDPEKSTRAAARHLKDLYHQFGDWYLAIAAYNCGPGVVEKAVERTGYADFWVLRDRRVLPAETTNYVPIILAMTIMAKNAEAYGIDNVTPDPPLEYDTIEMTANTHLALVGDFLEVPVSELATLNPSLLKGVAPAGFELRVPRGTGETLETLLATVPADRRATWRAHKVEGGETLAAIGKRYGASSSSIAAANDLVASALPPAGERLLIPVVPKTTTRRTTSTRRTSTSSKSRTSSAKSKARATTTTRASAKTPAKPAAKPAAKPVAKKGSVVARTAARSRASASSN